MPACVHRGRSSGSLRTLAGGLSPSGVRASIANCRHEIAAAEKLMKHAGIPFLDSTTKSIEEIATHVLHEAHLVRRVY